VDDVDERIFDFDNHCYEPAEAFTRHQDRSLGHGDVRWAEVDGRHHGFNRWLDEDWGYRYEERIFAVPYVPLLDPAAAVDELRAALDRGAVAVNVRTAPVPVPGGYRSPLDPVYDAFWGLAEEAGVVVATHAGLDGYDVLVRMWEPVAAAGRRDQGPGRRRLLRRRAVPPAVRAVPRAADGQRRERRGLQVT
jgi:hypothetical protein